MYTYKLKGTRWLRKYTAPTLTPSTSAGSDAEAIATNLCMVPWERSEADSATFPTYNAKEVDDNAGNREWFDTAEWCADHTDGSRHRCYANACFYRFVVPEESRGKVVRSVKVKVVCDPYTPQGARISVSTSDSDTLPVECSEVRSGDVHAEGVAPRLSVTNNSGNLYWYENSEVVELDFDRPLGLWLDVFIGLESWRARNGWLEGAARIASVEIVSDVELQGLRVGPDGLADMRSRGREWPVCRNGILPSAPEENSSVLSTQFSLAGDTVGDGPLPEIDDQSSVAGLSAVYAAFFAKNLEAVKSSLATDGGARTGAAFTVRNWRIRRQDGSDRPVWQLTASTLAVPFACPSSVAATRVRFDWHGLRATAGHLCIWLKRGAYESNVAAGTLSNPLIYTGVAADVDGWEKIGILPVAAGLETAEFEFPPLDSDVATFLLSAWCPVDEIDFSQFLPQGVGALDIDIANGRSSGFSTAWKPDITLLS